MQNDTIVAVRLLAVFVVSPNLNGGRRAMKLRLGENPLSSPAIGP